MLDLSLPRIMGILNATPDSFFDGGLHNRLDLALHRAEDLVAQGADIIDVGGASSRPGAGAVEEAEERRRVEPVIRAISDRFPEIWLSVDTWRASVARAAVEAGARMVNDISGGRLDPLLYPTLSGLNRDVPIWYVLMHMQGTPADMQADPRYEDVVTDVLDFFIERCHQLRTLGLYDIVLDPGFGFGKTVAQNYQLLDRLGDFCHVLDRPLLVGVSRKSMINRVLGTTPEQALNGSTVLHTVALLRGARILRVHDVRQAVEAVRLIQALEGAYSSSQSP
jgi:dihydropteroate synthase